MSVARRKVTAAATECFGAKVYAATKIVDIELGAGLTVGGGGTYRHFKSKADILEAVIDSMLDDSDFEITLSGDELEVFAYAMLDRMRSDLLRIYFHDLSVCNEITLSVGVVS